MGRLPAELVGQAARRRQWIANADLIGDAGAVVVFAELAVEHPDAGGVRDVPGQGASPSEHVAPVNVVVDTRQSIATGIGLPVGDVLDVAVSAQLVAGNARREALAQGHVQGHLQAPVRVIAHFHINEPFPLVELRALGDEVDGAAGGVAAEQRALGSAQDFHALHVEELDGIEVGGDGDFVQVRRNAGFPGAPNDQIADAANAEAGTAEVGGGERDVRCAELQVRRIDDLVVLQRGTA